MLNDYVKSKVFDKVTCDIKTAGTIAFQLPLYEAIFVSRTISDIYTGRINSFKLPIVINEDSKSLGQSHLSTKKVKQKTKWLMRSFAFISLTS